MVRIIPYSFPVRFILSCSFMQRIALIAGALFLFGGLGYLTVLRPLFQKRSSKRYTLSFTTNGNGTKTDLSSLRDDLLRTIEQLESHLSGPLFSITVDSIGARARAAGLECVRSQRLGVTFRDDATINRHELEFSGTSQGVVSFFQSLPDAGAVRVTDVSINRTGGGRVSLVLQVELRSLEREDLEKQCSAAREQFLGGTA